jgi:GTPase SAR1 family protein
MVNSLKIMSWNANGLKQHKDELLITLAEQKIDICLISETHFTRESYISLKGYNVYHTIHHSNCARGGSAVIIKQEISHYEYIKIEAEEFQVSSIKIKTDFDTITVASIYSPPRYNLKRRDYYEMLQNFTGRFIMGGDFNSKNIRWGSRLTTAKGNELYYAVNSYNCEIHSTRKPTYWPTDRNKTPDLIDFFVTKNISPNFIEISEAFDLNSDHSPIILTLNKSPVKKERNPTLMNNQTNLEAFKYDLESRIVLNVSLRTTDELDSEVHQFNTDIQQAAWAATPLLKKIVKGNCYPEEVRDLIARKRRIRKRWQTTRDPRVKTELNNITQELRRTIQELKQQEISTYLEELSNEASSNYSLWKATRKLKRPSTQIPPIRNENGTWARSNQEKADLFADHLEEVLQPNEEDGMHTQNLENVAVLRGSRLILPTTPREVLKEIKNTTQKKTPGFDLITGEILRHLPQRAVVKLTHLYNAAFRLKYVPRLWKVADVILIQKPGKPPNEPTSYRPISLLPILSKLFEKLLIKRLNPIMEEGDVIPTHQFGFRSKHSTIDQIHRITNVIEKSLEEKKVCSTVFLDVAQAFDKVWHGGLCHKLDAILPPEYSQLLKSYLEDRHFRIKHENVYSSLRKIRAGVPQGSVLGPTLYLLYTSDIPKPEGVTVGTFADDSAILAVGENIEEASCKLQQAVNEVSSWTKRWRIKLNGTKSVHVNFTNKKVQYIPISVNGSNIPHSNTAKYLGMTLDAKLKWKPHVKKKREELGLKYRNLYWLMRRKSDLSTYNKILLYKQILKPIWTYGIQLWGCTSPTNVSIIQRFQNKVLRNIVDAPWYIRNSDLHRDLEMVTVTEEIRRFAKKHEERLHQHVNVEAIQLLDVHGLTRRLKRTKPFELV